MACRNPLEDMRITKVEERSNPVIRSFHFYRSWLFITITGCAELIVSAQPF